MPQSPSSDSGGALLHLLRRGPRDVSLVASAIREPAPAVRGADKDRDDIQHQTELQERALDGIDSALDDLGVMSKVP